MHNLPIADYALLSDCRSAALVSRSGSVDWLCFPRFDGPSVFCRLLDSLGGHWAIHPSDSFQVSRCYFSETMVLDTTFQTSTGSVVLSDAMEIGRNEGGHDLGLNSPGVLLRSLVCKSGFLDLDFEYAPRPEYGLIAPLLKNVEGGVLTHGGADALQLSSPIEIEIDGSFARAHFTIHEGEQIHFSLRHRASWEEMPAISSQEEIVQSLRDTRLGWDSWSGIHQHYQGPWQRLVIQSGRILQALMYRQTGAIVAAPTTSLPEAIGDERNWDYRYTWIRDASLTMDALWVAACPDEAYWFFDWVTAAAATEVRTDTDLQIMFGVGGEHDLSERTIGHLGGWRGSAPVRVGNEAWQQRQLDVYGALLLAARRLKDQIQRFDEETRHFLVDVVDSVIEKWMKPDYGIWEIRGDPHHYLYSKLMCWVALNSALDLADVLNAQEHVTRWRDTRDEIRTTILTRGWNEQIGSFTQSFDCSDLDASALMMPIVGFIPATHPKMHATIETIARELVSKNGLLYRYRASDGLSGNEGTFLLCTFWLAHAQALAGDIEQARATFSHAVSYVNDVGLLAEEVEPETGELLGNFPQAFSHIGLVDAAWAIEQAEEIARSKR